ncbi:MAG: hypothetical protein R8G60_11630 [Roseovarius pacificus]|nr:hypothetical protein [Roseovarius pacificus]
MTCCELFDGILAGESGPTVTAPDLSDLRLAVLDNYVLDDLSPGVASAFETALKTLKLRRARISHGSGWKTSMTCPA